MTSVTSSKKWVVFKSALKRFKWLSILYGAILFITVPLSIWMDLAKQKSLQGAIWTDVVKTYAPHTLFNPIEHFINLSVSIIFGLILFHYLQKDRESTFFHSLPIRRSFLYIQNLLAGLTLIWVPIIINGFLIYGIYNIFGITKAQWLTQYTLPMREDLMNAPSSILMWKVIVYWFFISLLMTGLFYVFTIFIGMLTGNVLLQGALTIIGLLLPLGLYVLVKYSLWLMLYGFSRNLDNETAQWLSPLASYLEDTYYRLPEKGLAGHLWYLAAAILICGMGVYLYRTRQAEAAGETLAADWIRWIFKYGVVLCTALTGGVYLSSFNESSTGVLYLGYLIGAVFGYIVADMIAYKSFHFYRRWKGMATFGAIFILLVTAINIDLFGLENYVPAQDDVIEVYINMMNRDGNQHKEGLKEKENIKLVRQLHQQIIKMQEENKQRELFIRQENMKRARATQYSSSGPIQPLPEVMALEIIYTLDSGTKVKRTYNIDITRYREFLYPIFNSPEAKKVIHARIFKIDERKIDEINVTNHHLNKNIRIYKQEDVKEAIAALRKDVLNVSYESFMEYKIPFKANIDFRSNTVEDRRYGFYNLNYYVEFTNFEAFLARRGYLDELFMDPEDVTAVLVKKVGTEETIEVKDKQQINDLLNWGVIDDQKNFAKKRQKLEKMYNAGFYGKIIKNDGTPIFIILDGRIYVRENISAMFKVK